MEEMWTTTTTSFRSFVPQEIISDILSRLPAESLVSSFKFVCKAWRTLIKDPVFIKMHLNRGGGGSINGGGGRIISSSNNNHSLICKSGKEIFQLYPPFNFEGLPTEPAVKKLDFDLDLSSSFSRFRLVGSCNGLLCLILDYRPNIILLNPSTRKYKILPNQPIGSPSDIDISSISGGSYGFGSYNSKSNSTANNSINDDDDDDDEYKVVRIVNFFGYNHGEFSSRSQVDIYSMSSNSWRTETNMIDYVCGISNQQSGVLVNEALHWVAFGFTDRSSHTIASFDIRDEEFRQLPIPLSFHPTADNDPPPLPFRKHDVILMNMKGCLSMIRFKFGRNKMDGPDLEIWVMKEYDIQESWTKEFVIRSSDTDPPRALSDFAISPRSSAYVLKGDQILIEGMTYTRTGSSHEGFRKLVLYDINKRKIDGDFKMIGVPDAPDKPNEPYPLVGQVDYIETLVSLKSSIMVEE